VSAPVAAALVAVVASWPALVVAVAALLAPELLVPVSQEPALSLV